MKEVDYSLYLVTDSTPAILGDGDIVEVVEAAIAGGVTIVQYRDKKSDTAELVRTGKRLHEVCKKAGVPLLINDRVDVAAAVGCEGVHLGQDDLDICNARRILGEDAIIGISVSSLTELQAAIVTLPSYLGIGTVFATPTKTDTKSIIGPLGVQVILAHLATTDTKNSIRSVCIGGINLSNAQRVLFHSDHRDDPGKPQRRLDGVAVVSAIMASPEPKQAANDLLKAVKTLPPFTRGLPLEISSDTPPKDALLSSIHKVIRAIALQKPLCHNMTNTVVQNFAANVCLAIGGSPIMSLHGDEAPNLANLGNCALVVNMGTATPALVKEYMKGISAYNTAGHPVLLDPVGAGATAFRRNTLREILAAGHIDVVKGNESEMIAVAWAATSELETGWDHTTSGQKGVDSGPTTLSGFQKARLVRSVARRLRTIALMTGATDYLSDGSTTITIDNGTAMLGNITGAGCALGTTIATSMATNKATKLGATLAGVLMYELAAQKAVTRPSVRGPGTFVPAFIDELYMMRVGATEGGYDWTILPMIEILGDGRTSKDVKDGPNSGLPSWV